MLVLKIARKLNLVLIDLVLFCTSRSEFWFSMMHTTESKERDVNFLSVHESINKNLFYKFCTLLDFSRMITNSCLSDILSFGS